ncbi:MAG TPA: DUF493 domain-containing protein [Gammaproteobacteria bacterium]|nr:DUF493 domain-containing protein [Gammaproteobacteria bacterium]
MPTENRTSAIPFPCDFPIKVMGKADLEFQAAALAIIRKHVPTLGEAAVHERYSKGNKYLSLTVTVYATSQEQLDSIYRELSANEHVVMVL